MQSKNLLIRCCWAIIAISIYWPFSNIQAGISPPLLIHLNPLAQLSTNEVSINGRIFSFLHELEKLERRFNPKFTSPFKGIFYTDLQAELNYIELIKKDFRCGFRIYKSDKPGHVSGFYASFMTFTQEKNPYNVAGYAFTEGVLPNIGIEYLTKQYDITANIYSRFIDDLDIDWKTLTIYLPDMNAPRTGRYFIKEKDPKLSLKLLWGLDIQLSHELFKSTAMIGGVFFNHFQLKDNYKKIKESTYNWGGCIGAQYTAYHRITIEGKTTWDNYTGNHMSAGIKLQVMDSTHPLHRPRKQPLMPIPYTTKATSTIRSLH